MTSEKRPLKDQLMEDTKQAMKNQDKLRKGVIVLMRSALLNIEKTEKRELTREDELLILNREKKQNVEALEEAKKANRPDIIEETERKIAIIDEYLPAQLSEDEVRELLSTLPIDKTMKMGQIIPVVSKAADGAADNKTIAKIVKEYLA